MSILIKGMEMPKKKTGAVLIIYPDGRCAFENSEEYKAIPLPPHGRLIDADAIGIAEHEKRFVKRADRGDWVDEYIVGIVDGLHEAGRRMKCKDCEYFKILCPPLKVEQFGGKVMSRPKGSKA